MPKGKIAEHIKIDHETDPALIAKLQALSPYMYLKVNPLAKKLLNEKCDEVMKQYNISLSSIQPAAYAS
jgi:hypothetical protein